LHDKEFSLSFSIAPGPSALTHPKYRPDIDGLRAVAVLSVVAFHAFPGKLSGGFIGVDIFFVISGFLISTILFENLEQGTFTFAEFYRRRVRRIFPALILVLVTTMAAGWIVLFNDEFQQLSRHVAAGAAFVSNFALWQESGYFDTDATHKPLLHLWALGVEEQFYIVWPLLIYIGWRLRTNVLALTLVVAGASFAFNIAWRHVDPVGLFYSPLTRFWELFAGAILAYLTLKKSALVRLYDLWSHLASVVGTILIVGACVLLATGRPFPGWWALLPITGSMLLIAAGPDAVVNRTILRNPVVVWIGLISYPLYLWHWPLLSYLHILCEPTPTKKLFAVAAAIALAFLTYTLIEKRIRAAGNARKTTYALVGMIVVMLAVGILQISHLSNRGYTAADLKARRRAQNLPLY
jgi:peptidoglycan/LPS O-acetylase OafA/YrhL